MDSNNPTPRIGNFQLLKLLGRGSFSKVYLASNDKKELVAVKIECNSVYSRRLLRENQVYSVLFGGTGIPRVHWFGQEEGHSLLVMDALGPSLDDLFEKCSRQFTLKTVIMLAEQLVNRLEFIHSKYHVHRDVKPANFVVGSGDDSNMVYAVDFGLSARFYDYTMKHVPNRVRFGIGTPMFSSSNTHFRMTPSRRDDMESLAYMLIYFMKGALPWEGIKGGKTASTWELIADKKLAISSSQLCEGCPEEFYMFLRHCKKLEYEEKPDYQYIRKLFRTLAQKFKYEYDWEFDWLNLKQNVGSEGAEFETVSSASSKDNRSDAESIKVTVNEKLLIKSA